MPFVLVFLLCLVIMALASFCVVLPMLAICFSQISCRSWIEGGGI